MAQPFRHQCAALRIKPNSSVLAHEDELRVAECVDLTNNYLGGAGVQALTDILRNNSKLETLILNSNGLSNESVVFLCRALRQHPTLKYLDLSANPISLPAGLALLQFVHATATIEEIKLDGTLVDELLIRKIQRCININRGARSFKPAPAVQATLANIRSDFDEKKAVRERAMKIRSEVAEQLSNSAMRELASKATLPPRDPESGWLIVNIYASTTPGDFFSELDVLNNEVIPALNESFHSRKTHFVLSSLYHGLNAKQLAVLPRTCHADVWAALNKAPTIFLQFLGDKVGEFADLGESKSLQQFERENTPASKRGMCLYLVRQCSKLLKLPAALTPLYSDDPQLAHPDTTTSLVKNALLEARGIAPPPAHDPKLAHSRWAELEKQKKELIESPSKYASLPYSAEFASVDQEGNIRLRNLEALSAGITRRVTAFTDLLLSKSLLLQQQQQQQDSSSSSSPSPLTATPSLLAIQRAISSRAAFLPGRKSLTGKLDLYCVTPPSRNSLLLTHEPGAGATTLLAALNSRLEKRPGFIIASYYSRDSLLVASPHQKTSRDAKSMFLTLTQSLLDSHTQMMQEAYLKEQEREAARKGSHGDLSAMKQSLPPHAQQQSGVSSFSPTSFISPPSSSTLLTTIKSTIADDLDAQSAKQLFIQTLTDVASEALPKSIVVVVLVDGIDSIEFPENPCDALRRHEATGADDWPSTDPAANASTLNKRSTAGGEGSRGGGGDNAAGDTATASTSNYPSAAVSPAIHNAGGAPSMVDELEWIPTCLAKNVRFVLTCEEGSRAHQTLEVRGHDSCDVVAVPELGDADFEAIMTKLCEINGVSDALTEIDLATIRTKSQFRSPQYLQFVLESLISAQLSPQYLKRSTALSTVPDTIDRCCDALLDQFERTFGLALATLVCTCLAACSRSGGILDLHLRELIQRLRISRGESSASSALSSPSSTRDNNTSATSPSCTTLLPPLVNNGEFERVLRLLRPVIDSSSALVASGCNSNNSSTGSINKSGSTSVTVVGPVSASFHFVNIRCSSFVDCVRRRYLSSLEQAANAHKHMAHFYLRHCDHDDPFQLLALRAASYHVAEAGLWDTLEERILTLPFLSMVMRRKQAAPFFGVLVRAFNLLHPVVASAQLQAPSSAASSESAAALKPAPPTLANPSAMKKRPIGAAAGVSAGNLASSSKNIASFASSSSSFKSPSAVAVASLLKPTHRHVALLQLLREYIYFIRRHFRTLAQTPHLVAQLALLLPVDNTLSIAANDLLTKRRVPRLVPVLSRTRNVNLHFGLISGCQFTPSGLRIATGSYDGTVKVCNVMGEVVHTIRDGAAKVLFIKYSQTSRYLVAACENHVILVIDAASGQVVSKIRGHSGTIKCLNMTARGRNVLAGYEDRDLWVWDSESARHISTVSHHQQQQTTATATTSTSASAGASAAAAAGANIINNNNINVSNSTLSASSASYALSSQFSGVNGIIPHPTDERIVYTICDRRLVGSRILHSSSATEETNGSSITNSKGEQQLSTKQQQQQQPHQPQQFETLLNIIGHSSLPLAADSCYVVCDGTFALLCARDLVQQPPSFIRSESNIKVFSLQTGRMIAAFGLESSAPGNASSAVSCIVSPDERWLVAGSLDGTMRIYQPDWRTYSTIDDSGLPEPTNVRPSRVLRGFNDVPPRLMRFSFDSKSFLATANGVARIWPTATATATLLPNSEQVIRAQEDNMMSGFDLECRIEFSTPSGAVITSCDWSPNPSDDGAEIVIGDDRGKLYCLREQQ